MTVRRMNRGNNFQVEFYGETEFGFQCATASESSEKQWASAFAVGMVTCVSNKRLPIWGRVLSDVRHCLSQGGQAVACTYAWTYVNGLRQMRIRWVFPMGFCDRCSATCEEIGWKPIPRRRWLRVKQQNAIVCCKPCFALTPARGDSFNSGSTRPACNSNRNIHAQHQCCSTFWPALGGKSCQSCYCQNQH